MARILEHSENMKRALFISRESLEQFVELKPQVLKAYPGHSALESCDGLSGNPPLPGLTKTNMALDLWVNGHWLPIPPPNFRLAKANIFFPSWSLGLFPPDISQRMNSDTPDFPAPSVLLFKSIS